MSLSFSGFNLVMCFSILLQVLVFVLVCYFSYLYFLLLELWIFLIMLFFKPDKIDYLFFMLVFYILLFTSFLVSILFLLEFLGGHIVLFFLFMILKVLFFTLMMFVFQDSEFMVLNKFILIVYMFNFKLFMFLFVLLFFLNSGCISVLLLFFLDFIYLFFMFWLIFFVMLIKVLLSGNLEKYLFVVLNFSHYILFLSCFLNVKIFLYCSLLDLLVCLLVSQFMYLKHSNFINSFLGYYTSLFLFLFSCHSYGVPPFPSFLLEVCLVFFLVKCLGLFFSYIFLFLFYILVSLNFIFMFNMIGKVNNNIFIYNPLSDKCFLFMVLFLGIFLTCFFMYLLYFSKW